MGETFLAYFRGRYVPVSEVTVNIQAKVIQYGLGCFEGIRGYWDDSDKTLRIFRLEDHYRRLANSCRILMMETGYSVEKMMAVTDELCRRNRFDCDVYIRPIAFCNSLKLSPIIPPEDNEFAVYAFPLRDYLDTSKGITVCVSSWRRVQDNMIPARAKPTAAYLNSALARNEARRNGFDEAVFLTHDGYVSEGSAEHLFLVRNGVLITPTTQEDNLEGITRASLIELAAQELGCRVIERRVSRTELYIADELFFCGTGAEVTPVTHIDHRTVGDGSVGPVTRALQELFFRVVKGKVARFAHWCHVVREA